MNKNIILMAGILLPLVSACSTQSTPSISNADVKHNDAAVKVAAISMDNALPAPDLFTVKAGKNLKLVRIMEGGACKNNQQGAVGMFRLYANPDDIDRIKLVQGTAVFSDFENRIEVFSMRALKQAVNQLNFESSASNLKETEIQQQLADELAKLFVDLVADDISGFEAETSLVIKVIPLPNSLIIYLHGCETAHKH